MGSFPPSLQKFSSACMLLFQEYSPDTVPWPMWVSRITNISHFLLTFACSANFYIYFAKHSQRVQRLFKFRKWFRGIRRGGGPGSLGGSGHRSHGGLGGIDLGKDSFIPGLMNFQITHCIPTIKNEHSIVKA